MPDWHVVELVGYSRRFQPLILKKHKASTLNVYLGQSDKLSSPAMFSIAGVGCGFKHLSVMQVGSEGSLERRFPQISSLYPTTVIGTGPVGNTRLS
jgi:hypothetical protein